MLGGLLACASATAGASPLSASVGYHYFSGPDGQITRSAMAVGSASPAPGLQVSAGVTRYADSHIGDGTGLIGGLGLPVAPLVTLKAWGYRYTGDESFDAWRIKAGPEFGLPGGASLGLHYTHDADHSDQSTDGVIGELSAPLLARVTARLAASYASAGAEATSSHGSLGIGWSPISRLELSGEVGLTSNGWMTGPYPSRPARGLPILGGGGASSQPSDQDRTTETTWLVGATVAIP